MIVRLPASPTFILILFLGCNASANGVFSSQTSRGSAPAAGSASSSSSTAKKSCTVSNGTGTLNSSGVCQVSSCNSGYSLSNNSCVAVPTVTLQSALSYPAQGTYSAQYLPLDQALVSYMKSHSITAATMAINVNGQVVLSHAYGYSDPAQSVMTLPATRMRVASITKPFTAAIIQGLITSKKISASTLVFNYLGTSPYNGKVADQRIYQITVGELLAHTGGWDDVASNFDPMFEVDQIASSMGVSAPANDAQIISYMMTQPLQNAPGATYAYSNFGYCLLGRIIEKATGLTYSQALQNYASSNGYSDIGLAHSLQNQALSNEIGIYKDLGSAISVFAPFGSVPWPYGGFDIENMDSHGGMVTSAATLTSFAQKVQIDGTSWKRGSNWYFFGSLPGNYSLLRWSPASSAQVTYSILFNQREDASHTGSDAYSDIMTVMDAQIANFWK